MNLKLPASIIASMLLNACSTVYDHTIPVEDMTQTGGTPPPATQPESTIDLDAVDIQVKEQPVETTPPSKPVPEQVTIDTEPPKAEKADTMVKPVEVASVNSKPATQLLNQANQAASAGNYSKANVLLDRALAISPREPKLWHKKSQVMYQKGDYRQAASMAMRSNTMTSSPGLKKQNWRIIANAREKMGDLAGAEQARKFASQ